MFKRHLVFAFFFGVMVGPMESTIPQAESILLASENQTEENRIPGEYLAVFQPGQPGEGVSRIEYLRNLFLPYRPVRIEETAPGMFLLELSDDPGFEILQERLRGDRFIRTFQPNFRYKMQ